MAKNNQKNFSWRHKATYDVAGYCYRPAMDAKKKKTGRPSLYTEELGEQIVDRVAAGEDIAGICKSVGISLSVLHRWREVYPAFMEAYARARHRSGEASESRIQAIMDDARAGKIDANTARVLIDGEKWLAAKRAPRTHSDRVEVEHSGTVNQAPIINVRVVPAKTSPTPIDVDSMAAALPPAGPTSTIACAETEKCK